MNIYSIYKVTNLIDGKVYIGFTSEKLAKRKNGHLYDAFRGGSNSRFHKALRQFGIENWQWEVIYQAKEKLPIKKSHTLTVMEDYFINEYDSLNNGYNVTRGGGKFPIMRGKEHPLYSVGHSDKTKKLLSENHHDVSGPNNPRALSVVIVIPDGSIIRTRGDIIQKSLELGLNSLSLYNLLHKRLYVGRRGKVKGYQIYLEDEYESKRFSAEEVDHFIAEDIKQRLAILNKNRP